MDYLINNQLIISCFSTTWSLTKTKANSQQRVDYSISICSPLNNSVDKRCDNSYICRQNTTDINNPFIGEFNMTSFSKKIIL